MERKKLNKLKLFSILITTTFIFVVGIFFGQSITNSQLNEIVDVQQDLRTQTLNLELQYALVSQDPCNVDWNILGNELFGMSEMLARMEGSLGKLNQDVLNLKEYYSLLEVKHWLFLERVEEECNETNPTILYFYSNLGDCEKCERQGYVLTYLKKRDHNLNVFSFDVNLDNVVLNGLKELYDLDGKELPILIIDDRVYEGFAEAEDITTLI